MIGDVNIVASYENNGVLNNVHYKCNNSVLIQLQRVFNLFGDVPEGGDVSHPYFRKTSKLSCEIPAAELYARFSFWGCWKQNMFQLTVMIRRYQKM